MDSVTRYAAVNTKVRALEGQLLKNEDYSNLLFKKSVVEVATYLKQKTHYADILGDINENEIHRGTLEVLLKKSHINRLEKLVYYFHDEYKEFYKSLFIRYEIEDLKAMARIIKTGYYEKSMSTESYIYIGKYKKMNINNLLASRNLYDFIKGLKRTVYYDYLRPLIENNKEINLFSFEMTLDLAYFSLFFKNLKLINKNDRLLMQNHQGINIDLLNLQWIYRGLKFYNLPPEILFNYTIANGLEFNRNDIKGFCYSKNLDIFKNKILGTKYSFLFDQENTMDIFMERRILRYQYYPLKKTKIKNALNIMQSVVYGLFLETEIRDIISIIENIRYGMSVEEARKFLIRKL